MVTNMPHNVFSSNFSFGMIPEGKGFTSQKQHSSTQKGQYNLKKTQASSLTEVVTVEACLQGRLQDVREDKGIELRG